MNTPAIATCVAQSVAACTMHGQYEEDEEEKEEEEDKE